MPRKISNPLNYKEATELVAELLFRDALTLSTPTSTVTDMAELHRALSAILSAMIRKRGVEIEVCECVCLVNEKLDAEYARRAASN
jgi:hypothetical protein